MIDEFQVATIRSHFPIFREKIYLNSCSQGALSEAVESGFMQYLQSWHQEGSPWEDWVQRYEHARKLFSEFIGASADEVAVTTSASAAISAVASALDFRKRRKIVLGEFEFPTMGHVWLAQASRGAEIQFVTARGEEIPAEHYDQAIDADTAIVPITRICFKNGFHSPLEQVTAIAHERGALVMLDDYQDSGTRCVDVRALGVDFYVTGTLKYLLGPPGLAFMYVRRELVESLVPTVTGWFAQANPFAFAVKRFELALSARRFESGSPPIPNVYGAIPGLELLRSVGLANIAHHVRHLTAKLLEGAASLGFVAKTPSDSVGPLVVLKTVDADALVQKLGENDIVASSRLDGLRISLHAYNTIGDVEAVLSVLAKNSHLLRAGTASLQA